MQVAVCTADIDTRYALSRMTEEALLRFGVLPEMSLFPALQEMLELFASGKGAFDLVFIAGVRDKAALKGLCKNAPVILIGDNLDGPTAFEIGAEYFIENPVRQAELHKALSCCLDSVKKEKAL